MTAGALSISELYTKLEKASNPELASIISQAFEQTKAEQQQFAVQNKEETLKEVHEKDLATKKDVYTAKNELRQELELKIYKEVSSAKWQVIGSIVALFFLQVMLKHFGV